MNELYDRIDQICKARGTNVTALCKGAGVSRATLSELKAGRTKTLSIETAQKLADALQVSLNFLLGKFDDDAPISFVISTSELQDYIFNKKAPTPVSEDGPTLPPEYEFLNPTNKAIVDRLIVDLVKGQPPDVPETPPEGE